MVALFNRTGQAREGKDGASLRDRFRAWWEGYEVLEPLDAPDNVVETEPQREVPAARDLEPARVKLVQDLWGEGFSSPGSHEHILTMVNIFALDPAMTVIDLGAGLGGAARTMSKKFGVWVTGFEADKDLSEAGMALSVKYGMSEHVPIKTFNPDKFQHKPMSVDCVFSKEFLFTVEDKKEFLTSIEILLKKKGQLLFTDYVLAKPGSRSEAQTKWIDLEPRKPHPWALSDYKEALSNLQLEIRVTEDVTSAFRAMVVKGLSKYIQSTPPGSVSGGAAPTLVDEVELWIRRVQALDDGFLKVCRVHAFKKDSDKMMSDW